MNAQEQFVDEITADCGKKSVRGTPLKEYMLQQFLQGDNCHICDLTIEERKELETLVEHWRINTPITKLSIHRTYYDTLIKEYQNKPLMYAALVAAKDNLKLNFFGK